MAQTVTLKLPDEMLQRYQRGANIARKALEEFIVERLDDTDLPLADNLPTHLQVELGELEKLDDDTLWEIAESQLPDNLQKEYDDILAQKHERALTSHEENQLHKLGEEARRLTLKKSHAYMLLKWRGNTIPTLDDLIT
ncbi:MAG: hypothetical protein GY796_22650 [Chloroflexi bacterium]|nr:hypothetical protein [Chloroflexota bacterium]